MRKTAIVAAILGLSLWGTNAKAQDLPPQLVDVDFFILRSLTGDPFGIFLDPVAFDPATELAREIDIVRIHITMQLPADQGGGGGGGGNQNDLGPYFNLQGLSFPLVNYPSPSGPPLPDSNDAFESVRQGGTNYTEGVNGIAEFDLDIRIPPFQGRNQARLRTPPLINWDVRYICQVLLSSSEDPGCNFDLEAGLFVGGCEEPVSGFGFLLFVIEHPSLTPPNPPPFADAGPDQTVQVGGSAILDGSRTFDGFNVGFGEAANTVFDRDQLDFSWEWISGPERVDPIVRDPTNAPAIAEVNLNTVGTYIYRLTVDDNVNALPTQDSVTINVVSAIPANRGPIASIVSPTSAVVLGGIIQLDGTGSTDPDGDPLTFRWRQTNELGGQLSDTEIRQAFQPLSGLDSPVSSWQAVRTGT
ncbi:MAG: hypothetical protein JNG88_18240, partial [Phycisphaerales bacterium]|nr:hypothetical protein [Phycisphaerales bacterium]